MYVFICTTQSSATCTCTYPEMQNGTMSRSACNGVRSDNFGVLGCTILIHSSGSMYVSVLVLEFLVGSLYFLYLGIFGHSGDTYLEHVQHSPSHVLLFLCKTLGEVLRTGTEKDIIITTSNSAQECLVGRPSVQSRAWSALQYQVDTTVTLLVCNIEVS
jgi:hypothetical protein